MKTLIVLASSCLLLSFASCMKDIPPTFKEINNADEFTVAIANMNGFSETRTYTYSCTSDTNELSFSGYLSSGLIKLRVGDPNGNLLFDKTMSQVTNTQQELIAPHGNWTVTITGMNTNGTFRTELKKK